MDEVETAAADTTSEHSLTRYHAQAHGYEQGHMTTPNYPMAAKHPYSDHQPSWEASQHLDLPSGLAGEREREWERDDSPSEISPAAKRQRTESFGSQNLQMSPETSVRIRRHHGGRPVGIAQPIQLQDTQQIEPVIDMDDTDFIKRKSSSGGNTTIQQHSSIDNDSPSGSSSSYSSQVQQSATAALKSKQPMETFGSQDAPGFHELVTPLDRRGSANFLEDVYDSDQSQEVPRFDKFINESSKTTGGSGRMSGEKFSMRETRSGLSQESTTSEGSSESTGRFMAMYAAPNMDLANDDAYIHSSTSQSDVKFQISPPNTDSVGGVGRAGMSSQLVRGSAQREARPPSRKRERGRKKQRNPTAQFLTSQSTEGALPLPANLTWHLFVSHSTSNQDWARTEIVDKLSGPPHHMRVAACYQSMPDSTRYDDKEIHTRMRESSTVLIALTPSYLKSGRCKNEWQLAVRLHREGCLSQLVVAAVETCSRPEPLKSFLYLDFIDKNKYANVWDMLLRAISDAVQKLLPPVLSPLQESSFSESQQSQDEDIFSQQIPLVGGGDVKEEGGGGQSASPDPSSTRQQRFRLLQQLEQSSGTMSQSASELETDDHFMGMYEQQMMADFEAMYEEMEPSQSEGEKDGPRAHSDDAEVVVDPRATKVIDLSSTQELVSQVLQDEEGGEAVDERKGERSKDVEEGEVSDSSDERAGGSKKKKSKDPSDVAKFYNKLAQPHADKRDESPIFNMRNFNNWVKSILIRSHLSQLSNGATVLDLCCGKGGDMLKWKEGGIHYLICADISEDSVRTCENGRYYSDKMIVRHTGRPPFDAEFIVADCCEVRLRDHYLNPARRFNMTSCQFSIHYSFESYRKAHMMIRNACENLRPGGFFIGTTVDSTEVIHRLRKAGQNKEGVWSIGNDIFTVTLDPSLDINHLPLFGARYNFKLHGVVDLPEFLVHFPLLVDMLKDFDMELQLRQNFYDFFAERRYNTDDIQLLHRMKAFDPRKGTMSLGEWEAVGLYLVFVFRKRDKDRQRGYP